MKKYIYFLGEEDEDDGIEGVNRTVEDDSCIFALLK